MGKQRSEMLQLYRQAYRTKLRLVLYFVGCPWTNNRLFLIGNQQFPERCGTLLETFPLYYCLHKNPQEYQYISNAQPSNAMKNTIQHQEEVELPTG